MTTCGTAERSALRSQSEASATRSRAFSAPLRLAWRVITAEENSDCTYTDLMILIGLLNIAPGVCSMLIARCEQTRQNEHLRRPMFSCLSTCCNQRFDNHAKEFERGPRFFFCNSPGSPSHRWSRNTTRRLFFRQVLCGSFENPFSLVVLTHKRQPSRATNLEK